MPTDVSNLMEKVYDFFSGVYAVASTKQAFLAFEPFGLPMPSASFKDNNTDTVLDPSLAVHVLSEFANSAAMVNGSSIIRGGIKIDTIMKLLMGSSIPTNADAAQTLGAAKIDAATAFSQSLPVPGPAAERYHPVNVNPSSWYDPEISDGWTSHIVGQQENSQSVGASSVNSLPIATPPRRAVLISPPVWHVVAPPLRPVLLRYHEQQDREPARIAVAATTFHPLHAAISPPIRVINRTSVEPMPRPATPPVQPVRYTSPAVLRTTSQLAAIQANSHPQPVETTSISVSFDHCIGALTRSWSPDGILILRDWFVPGYSRGDISNGTGAGDSGLMPLQTTGFVAVRNLKVSANWSASDLQAIEGSASFGPFSLLDKQFESSTGTLTCPSTQIIGWFCVAFPVLPPVTDPTFISAVKSFQTAAAPVVSTDAPADPSTAASSGTTDPPAPASASTITSVGGTASAPPVASTAAQSPRGDY